MNQRFRDLWFGYVYVLKCGEFYKIGFSKKPYRRARKLRTASPYPIEVVYTLKTPHYKMVERTLHRHFDSKRIDREWFMVENEDLEYVLSLDTLAPRPLYHAQGIAYAIAFKESGARELATAAIRTGNEPFAARCLYVGTDIVT